MSSADLESGPVATLLALAAINRLTGRQAADLALTTPNLLFDKVALIYQSIPVD